MAVTTSSGKRPKRAAASNGKSAGPATRPPATPAGAGYLARSAKAVRDTLSAAEDLSSFLATAGTLTLDQRRLLVEQAMVLINENYVHLPLKKAMHAVAPEQALRLLAHRLEAATPSTMGPETEFHAEMLRIFASVRDLHTNYLLPRPYATRVAFLPFDVEEYFEAGERRYQVSHLVSGFSHPTFTAGVQLIGWSGVPMERAVAVNADRFPGSNPAARHARGVQFMGQRPLVRSLPPDETWVEVDYVDAAGTARSIRLSWMVLDTSAPANAVDPDSPSPAAASLGVDVEMDLVNVAKRYLFAPQVVAATATPPRLTTRPAEGDTDVPTSMSGVLRARSVTTSHGPVGHLRIFSFNVSDPGAFVDEVERLIGLLPPTMLIIDVRGNGGGHIYASEGLLQLFTPQPITPEPTQFIVSPLNRRLCFRHRTNAAGIDLGPWFPSIDQAVETSATYSSGFPITPTAFANGRGQRYRGRVLLVTDARCYSATDIFSAGFQDHGIGPVLGVDANTGAGGANVWTHELLKQLLELPAPVDKTSPYKPLPAGAAMRVAIRRTLRVGARAGTPVEDLGVQPDSRWNLTRNDLLNGNTDLIEHAAGLLAAMPLRRLDPVAGSVAGGMRPVTLTTAAIDRVDVYVGAGRPFASLDVSDGTTTVNLPATAASVRFEGRTGGALVVSARLTLA